ncbi:MAG: endonuclease/exonuclease/phosphatase family protein, partial [Nocardioidaceae bacterium]
DFVGYGTANDFEGSGPAPGLSNTTSAHRGAADTDDNAVDFTAAAPEPQNTNRPPVSARIHDLQGAAHLSPRLNENVADVPGVVTAVRNNGFWLQDTEPDADPATSEGIFVFTSSAPTVAAGDSVTVDGRVGEFRPGGSGGTENLTTTQLSSPTVETVSSGNPLPAVGIVGAGGRVPPDAVIDDDATGSVEDSGSFDATADGIDFWESLEGMRIGLDTADVVGPTNNFGELPVVPDGSSLRTPHGGILVQTDDFNPERILLDDVLAPMAEADTGDTLSGVTSGVLDYGFSNFKLLVTQTPTVVDGGLAKESATAAPADQLAVGTANVENLDPTDPQAKFDALAGNIVDNLAAPDVIALEEVQDNNGATNDGTVAADQTLDKLVAAVTTAGGPTYEWRQIDPQDLTDGGEPGGNIRVAFLYRTDRGLEFVDRGDASATTPTTVETVDGQVALSHSPGRVDPTNGAWQSSRKPLAGEFRWQGRTVFVIANHFSSKGADEPLFGRFQPPTRSSEVQRHQQATVLRGFVDDVLAADPAARVVVAGDINDFEFSETADILVGSGATALTDLPRTLPEDERYTYVFEGNSQTLDHILVSPQLATDGFAYDVVHVNAEFADQNSDHDPQVASFSIPLPQPTAVSLDASATALTWGDEVTLSGTLSVEGGGDGDLSDQEVTLQQRPAGSSAEWTDVDTMSPSAAGDFSFVVAPEASTDYRVAYPGGSDLPATSATVTIGVATKVTLVVSNDDVRKNEVVLFTGTVRPAHVGQSVALQRRTGNHWTTVDTATLNDDNTYYIFWSTKQKGSYTFRVVKAADADHLEGLSPEQVVRVR